MVPVAAVVTEEMVKIIVAITDEMVLLVGKVVTAAEQLDFV
tara:strand:- start:51 stop:173 length:123 start_codon:yes stop_codon:yes gene_type:complete